MSEFDKLKDNIKRFGGLCRGMIKAGNLGMTYSSTVESLEKDSLDIITALEIEKKPKKAKTSKKKKVDYSKTYSKTIL